MNNKHIFVLIILLLSIAIPLDSVLAAVGCELNDPDRDIIRIFPSSTGYKTEYNTVKENGGPALMREAEKKLGDTLDPVYETMDVPYAYYTVLKGKDAIGLVHGLNQKGEFGGMQIILATDLNGAIVDFYYQKLSSPEARKFDSKSFTDQFKGLTLADFYIYKKTPKEKQAATKVGKIQDPSANSHNDFLATLRGVMKNLILLDIFKLNRKYDAFINGGNTDEKQSK